MALCLTFPALNDALPEENTSVCMAAKNSVKGLGKFS